jgi:hypothetical protein
MRRRDRHFRFELPRRVWRRPPPVSCMRFGEMCFENGVVLAQ